MHQREKVIRVVKGKEIIEDFVFGSGTLTSNPPEIEEVKGYKLMKKFGFSIKFSNGKGKKPTFYALELWGKLAEQMAKLGFEGQLVEMSGRVKKSTYKTSEGVLKTYDILLVERFTCLNLKEKSKDLNKMVETQESDKSTNKPTEPIEKQSLPKEVQESIANDVYDDMPF